jgi:hypothetical protein
MAKANQVNWQSFGQMPLIAGMIKGSLDDTREPLGRPTKARDGPHVLDDAIIEDVAASGAAILPSLLVKPTPISFQADYSVDKPVTVRTNAGMETEVDMDANANASLRTGTIELRVTAEEKATMRTAADRAGLALSTWSRMLLLREARSVAR